MAITRIGTYAQIQGSSFKLPCKVATTGAITLSGTQTIDGVAVVAGDRVLVKDQGTGSTNGIYIVAAGAWSRAVDMSINEDLFEGLLIHVNSGTTNADKIFYLNTADPITLGVTSLTFTLSTAGGGSVAIGGTVTSGTTGSVLFINPTATLAQDNANLFWDDTNNRLGIGTTTPVVGLEVKDRSGIRITDTTNVTTQLALVNQTAASTTNVQISYTTNSGQAFIGKRQPSAAASGPLVASDLFIQNNDTANIVLYNSFASGDIKFAAGASTTSQLTLSSAGVLTQSVNQNAATNTNISNTTSGTAAQSQLILTSDATAGSGNLSKKSNTFTTSGIINLADLVLQNSTKGDIAILNSFATGSIKFAAGNSSTAQLTLNSAGNLTQSVNQNGGTQITISNTTSGTASISQLLLTSDASSGSSVVGKTSTTYTGFKIVASKDYIIYNGTTAGDIAILNDFASGTIKFATAGSSTAHVTIGTTGLTTFATGVDYKRLNPTTVTTASTATLTPDISTGDNFTITAQAAALSIANPTGTPVNGQKMIIRIKDNGTARAITFSGTQYRASSDLAFPTTTVINKTLYMGFIWNSTDSKWDMLALLNNF